jgi:hyperosmotically inducible protein
MKSHTPLFVLISLLAGASLFSLSGCEKSENVVAANQTTIASSKSAVASSKNAVDANKVVDNSQSVRDLQLAQKVDQAITNEESLGEFDIAVVAIDGVVRLNGEVNTMDDQDRLVGIVSGVEGVNSVDDQLTIKE